jgi:integrase
MPLTILQVKAARPAAKAYKLADGQGMYLEIVPSGKKYWRLKYRFGAKENRASLGVYPEVSLAEARDRRDAARKQLANGIDPNRARREARIAQVTSGASTLEVVAREWIGTQAAGWTPSYKDKVVRRLEIYIFPWLGPIPVNDIKAHSLLSVLRRIEEKGVGETAHRTLNICDGVFRYAIATERTEHNPAAKLKGTLKPTKERHHATIVKPSEIAALLRAMDGYQGADVTRCALRLAPLVFVRPGELRKARWSELDLLKGEWRIPAERMKMGVEHIVPLSKQAIALLTDLHPITGYREYVFPGVRDPKRPMSENTINACLRRLGYNNDEMTGHGFRSMASTLLNESGWNKDAIERQLAHNERDSVRAAYNKADHLPQRQIMMQKWANYLDAVRVNAVTAEKELMP